MKGARSSISALGLAVIAAAGSAGELPLAVSPGHPSGIVLIDDRCPTFSWGGTDGARGYELVIYRLTEPETASEPAFQQTFPGSVTTWTPSLADCLDREDRYAWSVRALGKEGASEWSRPGFFEVTAGPSIAELEAAMTVVQEYLNEHRETPTVPLEEERESSGPEDLPPRSPSEPATGADESGALPGSLPTLTQPPPVTSLVTAGALGVGNISPKANLHVAGSPTRAGVLVAPNAPGGGGTSELVLAEDKDGTVGVKLEFDGASNTLSILGQTEGSNWRSLSVDGGTGAVTFFEPVAGITPQPACFDSTRRFADCGNGTLTDTVTGLIYLKDVNCLGQGDWAAANQAAAALADGQCGLSDGSRPGDWRLHTRDELEGILISTCAEDPEIVGNGTPQSGCHSDNPWATFTITTFLNYWTSETRADDTTYAVVGCLCNGQTGTAPKSDTYAFWPIRDSR